jgi:hypothetical protein
MWQLAALLGIGLGILNHKDKFGSEAPEFPIQPFDARYSEKESSDDWAMRQKGYQSMRFQNNYDAEQVPSRKVRSISGKSVKLRPLQKDRDLKPEDAMNRLEISAESCEHRSFTPDFNREKPMDTDDEEEQAVIVPITCDGCRKQGETVYLYGYNEYDDSNLKWFDAETFNATVMRGTPKGYVGKAVATDRMLKESDLEHMMLQLETAVELGLISEDEIMRQLQEKFGSEEYAGNYMVPADIKSLARSVATLQKKAKADQNTPEWWKSKLSVVAAELDDLTDFFDYAEDAGML